MYVHCARCKCVCIYSRHDIITTNIDCPVEQLSILMQLLESNDRVYPSSQLPQAVPDLCELRTLIVSQWIQITSSGNASAVFKITVT